MNKEQLKTQIHGLLMGKEVYQEKVYEWKFIDRILDCLIENKENLEDKILYVFKHEDMGRKELRLWYLILVDHLNKSQHSYYDCSDKPNLEELDGDYVNSTFRLMYKRLTEWDSKKTMDKVIHNQKDQKIVDYLSLSEYIAKRFVNMKLKDCTLFGGPKIR